MQKKTIAISLAVAIAAAATGSVVYAQVTPHGPTRAEAQEMAAMAFDRMDVNVDGQLDSADGAGARAERMQARFATADANGDGALAYEEFAAAGEARRDAFADRRHGGPDGDRRGRHDRGGMGRAGAGLLFIAYTADANGDEAVSQAEYNAAVLSHFDRADSNDDGIMTREEAQAHRQALRTEAQARRAAVQPVQGS